TNFYVTPYDIEGLSWDRWSAGGPYLWVYHADKNDPAVIHATRLDPSTGGETGMSFAGVNLSGDESEPDIPKDIMVTPSWQENKLVMIALHDSNEDPGDGQDRIIVYDMDVTPAPGWIDLLSPTYGMTEPLDADTLLVRLDAIMEDTLMTAQIVISSNDVSTPDKIIPVNFTMLSGLPTFISKERTETPLVIFPNPASEQVTLNIPENRNPFTLHIYNNSGQLILNQTIAAGHTSVPISVSDWPRGIYLVNLTDGTTFMNTRLIKR
ncbi:MAG: T9SS type A sorting domain-containing protein, partial [bacterium]